MNDDSRIKQGEGSLDFNGVVYNVGELVGFESPAGEKGTGYISGFTLSACPENSIAQIRLEFDPKIKHAKLNFKEVPLHELRKIKGFSKP